MALNFSGIKFSSKGEYLAYTSPDGCLKIWDTSSNILKQEYIPSSHLSSSCVSLAWGPCRSKEHSPKKKAKRARSQTGVLKTVEDLNLIAMGTMSGDVLLYSVSEGDLYTKMSSSHDDSVNDIAWLAHHDAIFTCSSDKHIARWSISKGLIDTKWKACKSSVHSICVVDDDSLLSASSSIIWWNLHEQTIIKKFTGHATEIFTLLPICLPTDTTESKYFISSAVGDRVINVWHLSENDDCNAVASFSLPDEPSMVNISVPESKTQPLILSAVTKNGVLNIFEHQLNGRLKKPVSPKSVIQIAAPAEQEKKSHLIPVLAAKVFQDSCIVAYGNYMKPVFENMDFESFHQDTYLIRKNTATINSFSEAVTKTKEVERSGDVKVLAPGHMVSSKPTETVSRKKRRKASKELPMEERLDAISLGEIPKGGKATVDELSTPSTDSLVHLLLQGLQSEDVNLLNTVLRRNDITLISNTIKRLPLSSIMLLISELHKRISRNSPSDRPCLRWLKSVISVHLSYLLSLQDVGERLCPIMQQMEAKEELFPKFCQIRGLLSIAFPSYISKEDTPFESSSKRAEPKEETERIFCSSSSESEDENISEEQYAMESNASEDGSESNSQADSDEEMEES